MAQIDDIKAAVRAVLTQDGQVYDETQVMDAAPYSFDNILIGQFLTAVRTKLQAAGYANPTMPGPSASLLTLTVLAVCLAIDAAMSR